MPPLPPVNAPATPARPVSARPSIRAPAVGPGPAIADPTPHDRFPSGYVSTDETLLATARPSLWAFFHPIALGAFVVASGLFVAAVAANDAGLGGAAGALALSFALGFVVSIAVWARVLGRGIYFALPIAYFGGFYLAVALSFRDPNPTSSVSLVASELAWFSLVGLAAPAILALLSWLNTFYAVTNRRAIELTGFIHRNVRDLSLGRIQSVLAVPSRLSRWFGFGTVFLLAQPLVGGVRYHRSPSEIRRRNIGLAFYGVRRPAELAAVVQRQLPGGAASPSVAGVVAPGAASPGPRDTVSAVCGRCGGPLVWVAPSSKYYCPRCAQFA